MSAEIVIDGEFMSDGLAPNQERCPDCGEPEEDAWLKRCGSCIKCVEKYAESEAGRAAEDHP